MRANLNRNLSFLSAVALTLVFVRICAAGNAQQDVIKADVVIYGATPSGISAAVEAARMGSSVALFERTDHIGGLMANGLGATDIKVRASVGGLFREFTREVVRHYADTYGTDSQQVKDCKDGFYFEPKVAEAIFEKMISAQKGISVFRMSELDSADVRRGHILSITFRNRAGGAVWKAEGKVFIDATYEGDLAAMAGAPYRLGREARKKTGEPYAGVVYQGYWNKKQYHEISTGEGDRRIQAYNYRLCLTDVPENRVPIAKPDGYNPREYSLLARQVTLGQVKSFEEAVSIIKMPNGKSDTNNHTIPLISTDLPEENYKYPEADWDWRDRFAVRLRNYTLGFLYYCQNDPMLPESFREQALRWGLARDEYEDNGNFPRQVYVREARRIDGEYDFRAQDALVVPGQNRTVVQRDSIACGSYEIDSHATRKYEPGYPALEGLLGMWQHRYVYQIPYGVILPKKVNNLLVTGAISGSHIGFSTLRMEPCWMALGQAGGAAANLSIASNVIVRKLNIASLQRRLLKSGAVIMHFDDVDFDTANREALQFFGSRWGIFNTYVASPQQAVDRQTAVLWLDHLRRDGIWGKRRIRSNSHFLDLPMDNPAYRAAGSLTDRGVLSDELKGGELRPYESLDPPTLARWLNEAGIKADLGVFEGRNLIRRGDLLGVFYSLYLD